ncbi:LPS export ABC transporter periplasmic protein LptC [Xinfangfangia sp. CPCC 101601]|uniref:LPS export ABC transporter periplasmic protein LptC n=1 Tax=Pseudogemmobacter lacusdianii TaxID=3069608 RepID=A0ABU0VTN6_9RHOB|nr:LPS export ABC transporter periplasmic protein LptC [Xinfangfangia sp. CPCC 101601]MDQ2065092.1 LPS export ABC transporter periplasmic protein LptC [Xinfangfangia sp. CPCC 101601]
MPARPDRHSRMIGWLKVLLPLAALTLLATLFLFSDRIDPSDAIPYAKVDVEDLAKDPRMSAPDYAGTTADGAGITLSAQSLRDGADGAGTSAEAISALIETPDGQRIDISAALANVDPSGKELRLDGGVSLATQAGYQLQTEAITADLEQTNLASTAPVTVTAPMGDIRADSFSLTQDPLNKGAYLLVFNGGVRLLYQPGGQSPSP